MVTEIVSAVIDGVKGLSIKVEVDLSRGMPGFNIIGLADTVVKEAKDRVKTAIRNSKINFPKSRITVNFVPADVRKDGAQLDLPIALGIICAEDGIEKKDYAAIGELDLRGQVLAVSGIIPLLIALQESGYKNVIIPKKNLKQAMLLKGIKVFPVENLDEALDVISGEAPKYVECKGDYEIRDEKYFDFAEVAGQHEAKRALEIAASGGHHILFMGSAGSGKSMLAKRLPSIMPDLEYDEIIELTKIYSVSNSPLLDEIVCSRPFRSPHHSCSTAALCGGGRRLVPGEISLAHRGILFLDELPEFNRNTIESMRAPLEDKQINISRVTGTISYPANIILIAAFNPCPCGNHGIKGKRCRCSHIEVKRYQNKISAPILDRFDIQVIISAVNYDELRNKIKAEKSENVKARVTEARKIQSHRYGSELKLNGDMTNSELKQYCKLKDDVENILKLAYNNLNLSARSLNKVLKVSRTIADLDGSGVIEKKHIMEALSYRQVEKEFINDEF